MTTKAICHDNNNQEDNNDNDGEGEGCNERTMGLQLLRRTMRDYTNCNQCYKKFETQTNLEHRYRIKYYVG